ncbi:MAG: hypothetical protein Q9209_005028 [Squamulea sp. 1 TL-2023]
MQFILAFAQMDFNGEANQQEPPDDIEPTFREELNAPEHSRYGNQSNHPLVREAENAAVTTYEIMWNVIWSGDAREKMIGNFGRKPEGTYYRSRMYIETWEHWPSRLIFLTQMAHKQPRENSTGHTSDLLHQYYMIIDHDTTIKEVIHHPYPREVPQEGDPLFDSLVEESYRHTCENDDATPAIRGAGQLVYIEFQVDQTKVYTSGILIDELPEKALRDNQDMVEDHKELMDIFNPQPPADAPTYLKIWGVVKVEEEALFLQRWAELIQHFRDDQRDNKHHAWYPGSDPKGKIEKGKVVAYPDRPKPIIPYKPVYKNNQEMCFIEAFSALNRYDVEQQKLRECIHQPVQMRLLTCGAAGVNQYIALFRLPPDFALRIGVDDAFMVLVEGEEWFAKPLQNPFPAGEAHDIHATLYRGRTEDRQFSAIVLDHAFDLSRSDVLDDYKQISYHCSRGPAREVYIKPLLSDTPMKKTLWAIRTMNTAHHDEKWYREGHNEKWAWVIMGQDLRAYGHINIFANTKEPAFNPVARLQEWGYQLSPYQEHFIRQLLRVDNGLLLLVGYFGAGKTYLEVLTVLLNLYHGKKSKVLSSTNKTADSFTVALVTQKDILEQKGIKITDLHIIRLHTSSVEREVRLSKEGNALASTANISRLRHPMRRNFESR